MTFTKERIVAILFTALLVAAPPSVAPAGENDAEVKKLNLEEFDAVRAEKDVVLLDVRTPAEFEDGHVPGAVLINWRDCDFSDQVQKLDKSKKYVIYCAAGVRSANAAKRMGELGFTQLFDFSGGWNVYGKSDKPIETGAAAVAVAADAPAVAAAHADTGRAAHGEMKATIYPAAETKWVDGPPSLPKGAKIAVLEGDPAKEGPFVFRVKVPDGYRVPPHTHPKVERITVIEGTFNIGMGEKFDESKMQKMPKGTYGYWPAGMTHYVSATGETVLQFHGTGAWTINYVNPEDDPRNAKK
jgi:rhodanese-related sulfurtransferase/quercetin dioxygenase-like cupin family protein